MIALPTIRTVGMIQPVLDKTLLVPSILNKSGFDLKATVDSYERAVEEYKTHSSDWVTTTRPTLLTGRGICGVHRQTYQFVDWFGVEEWVRLREAASSRGYFLDLSNLKIVFKRVDWTPRLRNFMEVERG